MSFHRFNSFTGRLRQSTQLQALYPISPNPLQKVEAPKMVFDTIKTKPVSISAQNYSTATENLKKLQKRFQADPSTPSFLLRGTPDKILFGITVSISALCFIVNMYKLLELRKKY